MKVYAIFKTMNNRREYEDYFEDEELLCIKSTMELAQQFIDNYEFSDDEYKVIEKVRYENSINFVVWDGFDEEYPDEKPTDWELKDVALEIHEYEVEES